MKAKAAKAVSIVQAKANNLIKNAVKSAVYRLKHKKTKAQIARIAKAKADAKKALEKAMKPKKKKVVKKVVVVVKPTPKPKTSKAKKSKKPCAIKKALGGSIDHSRQQVIKIVNVSAKKLKKMKAKVKAKLVKREKKAKFV